MIAVDFARKSNNGRMTLVIVSDDSAVPVRTLWAVMDTRDIEVAKEALRQREGKPKREFIGAWGRGNDPPEHIPNLAEWAAARGIDAVIWTDLKPRLDSGDLAPNAPPSGEEVVSYLADLTGPVRDLAKEYIQKAPVQIDTPYRRLIEAKLGWMPKD